MPVEAGPRVQFAAWRDVLVASDVIDRVALRDGRQQALQRFVLPGFEGLAFQALELDADRIVVAVVAAAPARGSGVPGPRITVDELPQLAVAPHIEMRRDLQPANGLE